MRSGFTVRAVLVCLRSVRPKSDGDGSIRYSVGDHSFHFTGTKGLWRVGGLPLPSVSLQVFQQREIRPLPYPIRLIQRGHVFLS